jgi:uncharacterized protein YecE (DUF72 family)
MGRITVGTSSWADPGFVEEWYPRGMQARDRLAWYAERFDGVELNSSFYAIPRRPTVERWVTQTPDGFSFDVKLHQLLSRHSAKLESLPPDLRDGAELTGRGRVVLTRELEHAMAGRLLEEVAPLVDAGRLSSFLLQLTPAFSPREHELDELAPLIADLAPLPVAVEFRHRGWVEDERAESTFEWLSDHDAAFVSVDAPEGDAPTLMPRVDAVTRDDLAYLRLHGRDAHAYTTGRTVAERFAYRYSEGELADIESRAEELAGRATDTRVMFNNNRGNDAPTSARRLREMLGQDPGPSPDLPTPGAGQGQDSLF